MPRSGEYLSAARAAGWGIVHTTRTVEASMAAQARTIAAMKRTVPSADEARSLWEAQRDLVTSKTPAQKPSKPTA